MKATLYAKDLKRLIEATKGFVSTRGDKPDLKLIKLVFSKDTAEAAAIALDGYRMSIEHAKCFDVDEDFTAYIRPEISTRWENGNEWVFIEVKDGACFIRIGDSMIGYRQFDSNFPDHEKILTDITVKEVNYRIGFNVDLIIAALKAAKASYGKSYEKAILEFRGEADPVLIRTNTNDVKIALPVRLFKNE